MTGNLTILLTQNLTTTDNRSTTTITPSSSQQLHSKYNTNNDVNVSINDELKPKLVENFELFSDVVPGKTCTGTSGCPIWVKSEYALPFTLNIIGNVSSNTSILILQGENDTQTPVQQAFLLQQKLTDVGHPDHTLITYPNLGHTFYPSTQWQTGFGPIQQYVLRDLYSWLESHSGLTLLTASNSSSSLSSNTTKLNH